MSAQLASMPDEPTMTLNEIATRLWVNKEYDAYYNLQRYIRWYTNTTDLARNAMAELSSTRKQLAAAQAK